MDPDLASRWRERVKDVHVAGYNDEYYEADKSATFYLVFFNGDKNFVKKRYTNFLDLYDNLRSKVDLLNTGGYRFPNKSMFNTSATFTKERRKRGFDELLKIVVACECWPELLDFLDLRYQFLEGDDEAESAPVPPPPVVSSPKRQHKSPAVDKSKLETPPPPAAAVQYMPLVDDEEEDDCWPLFSASKVQTAALAAVALYSLSLYYGYISAAKSTLPRMLLTVALLTYCLLLAWRIAV